MLQEPFILFYFILFHFSFLQAGCPSCRPTNSINALKATEWWGAGVVICLERCADLHMAQLMPLPLTVSCFSKIQIGFTFLVPAHLGSPRQGVVKWLLLLLLLLFHFTALASICALAPYALKLHHPSNSFRVSREMFGRL